MQFLLNFPNEQLLASNLKRLTKPRPEMSFKSHWSASIKQLRQALLKFPKALKCLNRCTIDLISFHIKRKPQNHRAIHKYKTIWLLCPLLHRHYAFSLNAIEAWPALHCIMLTVSHIHSMPATSTIELPPGSPYPRLHHTQYNLQLRSTIWLTSHRPVNCLSSTSFTPPIPLILELERTNPFRCNSHLIIQYSGPN